jgi:hypothetical protein
MTAQTGPKRRPSISLGVLIWARTKRNVVEYLPRLARVGALLVVLFAGLFFFVGHRAKADIHEVMLGFGAQMMRYDGADRQGAPRQLFMNGERMLLATASTTNSLDTVLDYYEQRCMRRDGGLEQGLMRVSGANRPGAPPVDERMIDTTIRHETGARGYVMCLDMGEGAISIDDLTERLTAFADTGDLGEVGHLRYVYVTDEVTTRHVVTFWTEGTFNIAKMVPKTGDAPGRDIDRLPRPAGARRMLSAWEDGQPQSLTVYAFATQGQDALETFYRAELPRRGWVVTNPRESSRGRAQRPAELDDAHVLGAERDGRSAFLVLGEDEDGRGTLTVLTAR